MAAGRPAQSRAGLESGGDWRLQRRRLLRHSFQNTSTGQVSIWEMEGNTLIGGGPVSAKCGPAWKAIGTGDFNNDGRSDILFQNTTSGQVSIWEMNGNKLIGGRRASPNPGTSWHAHRNRQLRRRGLSDVLLSKRERQDLGLGNERRQPDQQQGMTPDPRRWQAVAMVA